MKLERYRVVNWGLEAGKGCAEMGVGDVKASENGVKHLSQKRETNDVRGKSNKKRSFWGVPITA